MGECVSQRKIQLIVLLHFTLPMLLLLPFEFAVIREQQSFVGMLSNDLVVLAFDTNAS